MAHKIWDDAAFKDYRWFYQIPVFDFMTNKENTTCGYFRDLMFFGVGRENGTPFVF